MKKPRGGTLGVVILLDCRIRREGTPKISYASLSRTFLIS